MKYPSSRQGMRFIAAAWLLLCTTSALAAGQSVAIDSVGMQKNPDVARAGSGAAVIVWAGAADDADLSEVMARRYGPNGEPVGAPFQVNQATRLRQYNPHVAMAADGSFVVAWLSEVEAPEVRIYARRFAANGMPLGPEFRVGTEARFDVTVALDIGMNAAGDAVIVWSRRRSLGGLAKLDIRTINARQLTPGGQLKREFRAALNPLPKLRAPTVGVAPDGSFVIVWHSDSSTRLGTGIFARRYRANGQPFGLLPRRIGNFTAGVVAVDTPRIAVGPEGGYVIAWTGYAADSKPVSVFLRRFNSKGRAQGRSQQIGDGLSQPSIAVDASNRLTLVAVKDGRDIVLRRFRASGELDARAMVEGSRPYQVLAPTVDVDAHGRSLIAWQDFGRDGDSLGVFAKADTETTPGAAMQASAAPAVLP